MDRLGKMHIHKMLEEAENALQFGYYDKASTIFSTVLSKIDPEQNFDLYIRCNAGLLTSKLFLEKEKGACLQELTKYWEVHRKRVNFKTNVQIGIYVSSYYISQFKFQEAEKFLNQLIKEGDMTKFPCEMGKVYFLKAFCLFHRGKTKESTFYIQQAFELYRKSSDENYKAYIISMLGLTAALAGFIPTLNDLLRDTLKDIDKIHPSFKYKAYIALGGIFAMKGQFKKALNFYSEAYSYYKKTLNSYGDKINYFHSGIGMAIVLINVRNYTEAKKILYQMENTLKRFKFLRGTISHVLLLVQKAKLSIYHEKDYKKALKILDYASQIAPKLYLIEILYLKAIILLNLKKLKEGLESVNLSILIAENYLCKFDLGIAYRVKGELLAKLDRINDALEALETSKSIFQGMEAKYEMAKTLLALERLRISIGKQDGATISYLWSAREIFSQIDELYVGWTDLEIARSKLLNGDLKDAVGFLKEAEKIFSKYNEQSGKEKTWELYKEMEEIYIEFLEKISQKFDIVLKIRKEKVGNSKLLFRRLMHLLGIHKAAWIIKRGDKFKAYALYKLKETSLDNLLLKLKKDLNKLGEERLIISVRNNHALLPVPTKKNSESFIYVKKRNDFFSPEELLNLKMGIDFLALKFVEEESQKLELEILSLKERIEEKKVPDIITQSEKMSEILEQVELISNNDSPVLIEGETGTGKDLLAKYIHMKSSRSENPFVSVNCASIPSDLLESELFGYVRGAFTGAIRDREGKIKAADGGTLFLNEIGEFPVEAQAKLLRFLDTGEFEPLGSNKTERVDVRIIAATNRDLESMIENGIFRQDLFHRLAIFRIKLPPLRERREDIPILVDYYIKKYKILTEKEIAGVTPDAMELLIKYDWPGNVRELLNEIKRAISIVPPGSCIDVQHLDERIKQQKGVRTWKEKIEEYEKGLLLTYLEICEWRLEEARKLAGLPRSTFYHLLKKYKLKKSSP